LDPSCSSIPRRLVACWLQAHRPALCINENILGHLNPPSIGRDFFAPDPNDTRCSIEGGGGAADYAFPEADDRPPDVSRRDADGRSHRVADGRTRVVRACGVVRSGATRRE